MIRITHGNLLEADVDALVNTVNTVGVMGKGVALQFKQAFPHNFKAYERACNAGDVKLGTMFVFDNGRLTRPYYIINFPTKKHWRSKSKLSDIELGLDDLVKVIKELRITSLALPPLGAGSGGLNWRDVRGLIVDAMRDLEGVDVHLYPPEGAPSEETMKVATDRPAMTPGRAALVQLARRYMDSAGELMAVTQIELQKLMYFMQAAGEDLRLQYVKGIYGPYADNLNHVLRRVEGHYLRGYGDRSRSVNSMAALTLLPGAFEEAADYLADRSDTLNRFGEVIDLISGFESPYGLELLSTVHWVGTLEDVEAGKSVDRSISRVKAWSRRKARLFTDAHIAIAWRQLTTTADWFSRPAISITR